MTDMTWTVLTSDKDTAGSIKRWVNDNTIDPEEIIAEAESWLCQRMRVRRMQVRMDDLALLTGESSINLAIDVPDFLDPVNLWLTGDSRPLSYQHEDKLEAFRQVDSAGVLGIAAPTIYTIIGETLYFDAASDADYLMIFVYYGQPIVLSASNQTNIFTTKYRPMFKKVLMGQAYLFMKDEQRGGAMLASAGEDIQQINVFDDMFRRTQEYDYEAA